MSDHLPHELVREILSRLPVKSLLKFRCVSKAWNFLITSPSFIAQHLKQTPAKKSELHLFSHSSEEMGNHQQFFLYPYESFPLSPIKELVCAFKGWSTHVNIVGSCNGVVCLSDDFAGYIDRAALWNPSVRKTLLIPINNFKFKSHGDFFDSLGFGFDSLTNDYKLVRIVYLELDHPSSFVLPPLVEVYTLRSGCWRVVDNDLKYEICGCSAFVKGACHWIGATIDVIVSFDLGKEAFGEMAVPFSLDRREGSKSVGVAVLDETLVLVQFAGSFSRVWMMKEYGVAESWTKTYNVEKFERLQKSAAYRYTDKVLLGRNGGISGNGELVLYDSETNLSSDTIFEGSVKSFYLDTLMESLIFLGEADEVA